MEDVLQGLKSVLDIIGVSLKQKSLTGRVEATIDELAVLELLPAHGQLVTSSQGLHTMEVMKIDSLKLQGGAESSLVLVKNQVASFGGVVVDLELRRQLAEALSSGGGEQTLRIRMEVR